MMKYTKLVDLDPQESLVLVNETIKKRKTISFPKEQLDVFDALRLGKDLNTIEEESLSSLKNLQKKIDRLLIQTENSHLLKFEEYEVLKNQQEIGWRIELLYPNELSLKEFKKYHTLSEKEEEMLLDQIVLALQEAMKADLPIHQPDLENIYVVRENEYRLDLIGSDPSFSFDSLQELFEYPKLKQKAKESDLWTYSFYDN